VEAYSYVEQLEEWYEEIQEQVEKISESCSDQQLSEPLLDTTKKRLSIIFRKIQRAIALIVSLLPDLTKILPLVDQKKFSRSLGEMVAIASCLTKNKEPAFARLAEGGSLQEVLEISDETLDTLYQVARHVYEQQHYEEASGIFCFLSLLNPSYTLFWIGLGNSEYFLGKYSEALLAYSFSVQTDDTNPFGHIYCARCHIALHNNSAAEIATASAEMVAQDQKAKDEIQRLKTQIRSS